MSRALNDLSPAFRIYAVELLARLVEAGVPVMIIDTLRTQAEQDEAVRTGHSKVKHSKHQDGLAIDLCPYETFAQFGPDKLAWDRDNPAWATIGKIVESLGMGWGGRFGESSPGAGDGWDPGHVQYKPPKIGD